MVDALVVNDVAFTLVEGIVIDAREVRLVVTKKDKDGGSFECAEFLDQIAQVFVGAPLKSSIV